MNRIIISILFILFAENIYAKGLFCNFEEVYKNGEIQTGHLLLQDQNLRYEYHNKNLYTLFYVNELLVYVSNDEHKKFQLIEDNDSIIKELVSIYNDFPNIKDKYSRSGKTIIIEKNDMNFVKRIGIISPNLNLSIFFIDCREKIFEKNLFNFNPFVEVEYVSY